MTEDKIGRKEIVDKICGLVDNLQKDQNFCLALNGEWGSGKTFVMQMIKEELSKHQEYTVIEYDAWENSFYSEPLISILSCIIDSIQEKLSNIEGFEDALKDTGKEVLNEFLDSHKKAKFFYDIFKGIKGFVNKINEPFSKDTNSKSLGEFKSYKTLLKEVKDKLNLITTYEEYKGKQNKLIILVDEIDRCLPDDQLKILERLHHLFDIKNCAVVCALNKNCIVKNIETTYGVDGKDYLRKFFNFNYTLETKQHIYLQSLLKGFYNSLHSICEKAIEEPIRCAYQCLVYGDKNILDKVDNRELLRYSELLSKVCEEFGWQNLDNSYVFFIIIALLIRKEISKDFLSKKEIMDNQEEFNEDSPSGSFDSPYNGEMPYYDYLEEYLGIDRANLPKEFYPRSGYQVSKIPEYSWDFSEIICYSLGKEYSGNEMRAFFHERTIYSGDCVRLRELIIK